MNNLKVAIIEDEVPAARLLHSMLKRLRPQWEIVVLPGNIEEAVAWFDANPHPELLFLDIHLSDGNSFDFLSLSHPSSIVIFTTAYDQYAIRAFSVNSIDYLLKPIDEKRLLEAILKYESIIGKQQSRPENNLQLILESLQHPEKRYRSRFLIPGNEKSYTLDVADIAYFYSENKITFAVTFTGQEHLIDLSLNKLSEQLDPDRFFPGQPANPTQHPGHHPHRTLFQRKNRRFCQTAPQFTNHHQRRKDLPIQTMVELLIFRGILLPE